MGGMGRKNAGSAIIEKNVLADVGHSGKQGFCKLTNYWGVIMQPIRRIDARRFVLACALGFASLAAFATDIAQFKVAKGAVYLERGGKRFPAYVGTHLQATDTVVTGANGSAGITFIDNSLLSVGPNSVLQIERYAFNSTTHEGVFDTTLSRGTLSMVSGKIAKQSPDSVKVRTPSSILGVRGTEFLVRTGE
jgi:hypothetical protein